MPRYPVPFIMPGVDVSDADAAIGNVLSPRTFYSVAPPRKTGVMPTVALNPASTAYQQGYHAGNPGGLPAVDVDLIKENILAGKTIFGVGGIVVPKLEVSVPAVFASVDAEAIVTVAQSVNKNAPFTSEHKEAYLDAPADLIKRVAPTLASSHAETIVTVAQSTNKNAPIRSDLSILVDGFVEETAAGVQTDKTAQARSAATNDLNLCPMVPTVLDKVYIGCAIKFWRVWMTYGQAGTGNWLNHCYYWNGAWVAVVGEDDQTSSFLAAAGIRRIDHVPQGDWALSVIQGMNLYWLMIQTDVFVNQTAKPLGSQVFISIA